MWLMLKWEMLSRCYEKLNLAAVLWEKTFAGFSGINASISVYKSIYIYTYIYILVFFVKPRQQWF